MANHRKYAEGYRRYCNFLQKPYVYLQRTLGTQLALFWIRRTHIIYNAYEKYK